jgi:hypothetical protein
VTAAEINALFGAGGASASSSKITPASTLISFASDDATPEKRVEPRSSGPKLAPPDESSAVFSADTFIDISRLSLGGDITFTEYGLQSVDWSRGDELDRLASQFVSQIASVSDAGKLGVGGFDERERFVEGSPRLTVPSVLSYEP